MFIDLIINTRIKIKKSIKLNTITNYVNKNIEDHILNIQVQNINPYTTSMGGYNY